MSSWRAPGRLNLIGEHTDYNEGYVLPLALPYATTAIVAARTDGVLAARSARHGTEELRVADLEPGRVDGWAAYVAGVVWAFRVAGHEVAGGFDVTVDGDVPEGAGLSSSAALECSVAAALDDLLGLDMDRGELARLAQRAENEFVGIPSGVMDQMASLLCTKAHVLFLDCRSLATEQVPLEAAAAGLSRARRRQPVAAPAHRLGVRAAPPVLRTGRRGPGRAGAAGRDRGRPGPARRRAAPPGQARGDENGRVLTRWPALRRTGSRTSARCCRLARLDAGRLRDHRARVDLIAATAEEAGALGARMTGGGFGGCVLALVPTDRVDAVKEAVSDAYGRAGYGEPGFFPAVPSSGARKVDDGGSEVG
jgi:galactokinase